MSVLPDHFNRSSHTAVISSATLWIRALINALFMSQGRPLPQKEAQHTSAHRAYIAMPNTSSRCNQTDLANSERNLSSASSAPPTDTILTDSATQTEPLPLPPQPDSVPVPTSPVFDNFDDILQFLDLPPENSVPNELSSPSLVEHLANAFPVPMAQDHTWTQTYHTRRQRY